MPWVNGTAECLKRDILAALRAVLVEMNLAPQDCLSVIGVIQSVINRKPEE